MHNIPSGIIANPCSKYLKTFLDTYADVYGKWICNHISPWCRHQMEIFSALLVICAVNSPVTGELPAQRPVTRSFDIFFDLRLNKRLCKHSWGWWFETHRAHYDVTVMTECYVIEYPCSIEHGYVITHHSIIWNVILNPRKQIFIETLPLLQDWT